MLQKVFYESLKVEVDRKQWDVIVKLGWKEKNVKFSVSKNIQNSQWHDLKNNGITGKNMYILLILSVF